MDNALPVIPHLPNEASEAITQILVEIFRYRFHQDVRQHLEDYRRFQEVAQTLRNTLEEHTEVPVEIQGVLGQYDFQTVLQRAEVKAWLQLKQEKSIYSKEPPKDCPVCKQPLMQQWTCLSCGVELESPYQRMQTRGASQKPTAFLPYHHVLLADPERRRLVFLDCHFNHQVVWEIAAEQWNLQAPWQAILTEKKHILVVDRVAHRLVEVNLFGEVLWEWDTQASAAHVLQHPVKVSPFLQEKEHRLLVVDQGNHRVIICDYQQNIHWEYGVLGQAGIEDGHLNSPSDAQITSEGTVLISDTGNRRLLEVDLQSHTPIWRSPQFLELKKPVYAQRLLHQHLLFVDAETHRIVILNNQGEIDEECFYFTQSLDPSYRLEGFVQAFRRENQHLILTDSRRVLEIDIGQKHLLWMSVLNDLNFAYHDQVFRSLSEDEAYFQRIQREFRPQKRFKLKDVLKQAKAFRDAPPEFFAALEPLLTQHQFAPEQMIVKQGEEGSDMYLIQSGQVEVFQEPHTHLATLEVGDIFGEMAILFSEPRSASVKAKEATQVYRLSKTAFETVIQAFPELREQITRLAQSREQVNRLKNSKFYSLEKASGHLKELLQAQEAKVASIKTEYKQKTRPIIAFKPAWRLAYNPIDQHIIHEALETDLHCFEIHLDLKAHQWSVEEVSQMIAALEQEGTVIKLFPDADTILNGGLEREAIHCTLALTYLSDQTKDQVIEDLMTFESVNHIQLFSIFF